MASWSADELRALAEFITGLTELTAKTGVEACVHAGTEVQVREGDVLRMSSTRDGDGRVSYQLEHYPE